jgi:hypothetical protein
VSHAPQATSPRAAMPRPPPASRCAKPQAPAPFFYSATSQHEHLSCAWLQRDAARCDGLGHAATGHLKRWLPGQSDSTPQGEAAVPRPDLKAQALIYTLDQYPRDRLPGYTGARGKQKRGEVYA